MSKIWIVLGKKDLPYGTVPHIFGPFATADEANACIAKEGGQLYECFKYVGVGADVSHRIGDTNVFDPLTPPSSNTIPAKASGAAG